MQKLLKGKLAQQYRFPKQRRGSYQICTNPIRIPPCMGLRPKLVAQYDEMNANDDRNTEFYNDTGKKNCI